MPLAKPFSIKKQIGKLCKKYPLLKSRQIKQDSYAIFGTLKAEADYQNVVSICEYEIKIRVPSDYPLSVPTVFEVGGKIDRSFHRNPDGSLCLAVPAELKQKFNRSKTLVNFVDNLVIPFLFSHKRFIETGTMPYGELSHGSAGVYQYYCEHFKTNNPQIVAEYLSCLLKVPDKTDNNFCPCGSSKSINDCHKRELDYFRQSLSQCELIKIVEEGKLAIAEFVKFRRQNLDKVVRGLFHNTYSTR